jgi:hypothetical protein
VDWLDLPIVSGDPFVPVHPCRVLSKGNAWLFQPHSVGGGIWCRVPGLWTTPEGLAASYPVMWHEYAWIVWEEDGPNYRLRIGLNAAPGIPTGLIETIDGEWSTNAMIR